MQKKTSPDRWIWVGQLLGVIAIVGSLYVARDIFIPLTLAILLSFLLSPIVNRIQRLGLGNVYAVITTAFFVFIFMGVSLTLVGRELSALLSEVPSYKTELITKARGLAGLSTNVGSQLGDLAVEVSNAIEKSGDADVEEEIADTDASPTSPIGEEQTGWRRIADNLFGDPVKRKGEKINDGKSAETPLYTTVVSRESSIESWAGRAGSLLGPLGTTGLVTVCVLFLLVYRDDMRDRVIKIISRGNYVLTTEALNEVSRRISKYLLAQSAINISYGLILSLGLFIIGRAMAPEGHFPNFVLWGVLATLFRFVPYVGPIAGAAFPIILSIAIFPGYAVTLAVVSLIVVLELISNNIVEPWLYGASTGLSPVAVIFAAVFWGWLWGPLGLLLSTPLTVCLVVIGRHVPQFRVFTTLLGEEVNIRPSIRFYQRLLSNDVHKASDILVNFVAENNAMTAIDEILVPALRQTRTDQELEQLSASDTGKVIQNFNETLSLSAWGESISKLLAKKSSVAASEKLSAKAAANENTRSNEPNADAEQTNGLRILACPAHDATEELVLRAFAKANPEFAIEIVETFVLADSVAAQAVESNPDAILIGVIPPGGFVQARYLCRAIRDGGFRGTIIVCCCGRFVHFDKLFVKFRKSGANYMTTSFAQTSLKLHLMHPRQNNKRPAADGGKGRVSENSDAATRDVSSIETAEQVAARG